MGHRFIFIAVFFYALLSFSGTPVFAHAPSEKIITQLPDSIRPTHYTISLNPNAAAASFTSKVLINIDVLRPTSNITLNAVDLNFQNVLLISSSQPDQQPRTPTNIIFDKEKQTASIHFAHPISIGAYALSINYSGIINAQTNGLFFVDYETPARQKRALYTQFEIADARRFVPSWDEPAYKATFALDVITPDNQMAVSNMPVSKETKLPDGRNLIHFATTPKMSSYLLFFALGDFARITDNIDGTEVGIVTQAGISDQGAFALAAAKETLNEYNHYFGMPYALPKLDNVAVPGKSPSFAAMENWGAILTFEYALLINPTISAQRDKEVAFITAAHEMAHQWFGNLVTMRWWDDLWLNEGFASWLENHITNRLHPEWSNVLNAVSVHDSAMELDSLSTTHPIVQPIDTVEQASLAFDQISYQKGESIIRMLENYVGSDTWRDGVRVYMKEHAYGNTTSDDLWRAVEQVTTKPVTDIAHDFTLQPGIPMIKVNQVRCDNGNSTIHLSQSEFSRDHVDKKPLSWKVPVTAQLLSTSPTQATQPVQTLVTEGKAVMHLPGCGPIVVNAGQAGYFRTWYAPEQFTQLANNFMSIAPIDQLGLLSDSWALGLTGLQPVTDFLNLASTVPVNADPYIWGKIANVYSFINRVYRHDRSGSQYQKKFREFAIAQLTPVMNQLGWNTRPDDSTATLKLRELIVDVLGQLGDPLTIAEANRRYANQDTDPADFPVELRKSITHIIALHADAADWEKLHAKAQAETSAMVKDQLYTYLASSYDPTLAARALEIAVTDEPGTNTRAGMISEVSTLYPDLAFDFAMAHLDQVHQMLDSVSHGRYIPNIASGSTTPAMIDKIQAYANAHLPPNARGSANTAMANIRYHIKILAHRIHEINAWLDKS